VVKNKSVCTYTEQYPGTNIVNYFSLSWGKPTSRRFISDILSGDGEFEFNGMLVLDKAWRSIEV
jgi:hypothetical protein